jgi:ATP-dependent RNA helicase DHX29
VDWYRDPGVKLTYKLISSTSFSNRYALVINWSKDQDLPEQPPISAILCTSSPRSVTVSMFSISTPDTIQSEAYIATAALFLIFSASKREEKVYLRLPHIWKELWEELATAKQEIINSADREALRNVRELVREKNEREEEEGVVLTNGFRKRNVALNGIQTPDESVSNGNHQDELEPETLRQIWQRKCSFQCGIFEIKSWKPLIANRL